MSTENYSAEAFYAFFDYAVDRGLINRNTGESRKTAAKKILSALKPEELKDLRELDREMVFRRFQNLNATAFTPASLATYKSRFEAGLNDFLNWSANPSNFKPGLITRAPRSGATPPNTVKARPEAPQEFNEKNRQNYAFPIPIREGKVVVRILDLPTDLTSDEARRIAGVITALAVHTGQK